MRVKHPLGLAGGSGREAKACSRVFWKFAPLFRRWMSRNQKVVVVPNDISVKLARDRTRAADHHHVTDGRAGRQDPREPDDERAVHDDNAIGGAIDDVLQVRAVQMGIERMADGADPHDSIPAFEMSAAVHGHSRDAIARPDAERYECRRETPSVRLVVRSSDP